MQPSLFFLVTQLLPFLASAWTAPTRAFLETSSSSNHAGRRSLMPLKATRLDYRPYSDDVPSVTTPWELPEWLQRRLWKKQSSTASSSNKAKSAHRQMPSSFRKKEDTLTYMPFRNWQMEFMQTNLNNLRQVSVFSKKNCDMSYIETPTHRMHTACYESDEYRLIRMTTLDAGKQTQVFTSLWYPRDNLMPVLGVDLLQFGQKTLCIVDFQPITADRPEEQAAIEKKMAQIRDNYPSLQTPMTDRFYSASDTYFSKQMLLGRHDPSVKEYTADELIRRDLFPAFQQYVSLHTTLVKQAERCQHDFHEKYDTYSAARDPPAHHLLAKIFGQEWADDYVYDILFPGAKRD